MAFAVLAHSYFWKPQFVSYTIRSPWGLPGCIFDITDIPWDQIPPDFTMLIIYSGNPLFPISFASDCWEQTFCYSGANPCS